MNLDIVNNFIDFFIHYNHLTYFILFLGSMFETIIGFSFFIYGEVFFLSGSILAGMEILNIWYVIFVLYLGGIIGDNISYLLGKKYGFKLFKKFTKIGFFKRYINRTNLVKSIKFFRKYGSLSVFLGRLLGPISWITPFVVGAYKLEYKKFLPYEIMGVVIGIGQFIIVGYFFGKHFDFVLQLVETYTVVLFFIIVLFILVYYYLKKYKILKEIKNIIKEDKKKLFKYITQHSFTFMMIVLFIYIFFLLFIFFVDKTKENIDFHNSYNISLVSNISCNRLGLYYLDSPKHIIQPINIIIQSKLNLKQILDNSWIQNEIFQQNKITFFKYIHLFIEKKLPISSLYFIGLPQNFAYQYKNNFLSKREHIRFWKFRNKNSDLKTYYASISYDDGYEFSFYNYFITPIHKIEKNIDKSRDFFIII